jgi:hemolysin activation/secretion protein
LNFPTKRIQCGVCLSFLFTQVAVANSPDIERIAPKQVPSGAGGALIQEGLPELEAKPDRDAVLVDALRGIVFINDVTKLDPTGRSDAKGVVVDGDLELLDSENFQQRFEGFLQQPISLNLLDQITREVVRYYRDNDRPVVDALALDGQDITDGVLQIAVILGKRGDVRVEGAKHFSAKKLASKIRVSKDDTLTKRKLEQDIAWLNNNPFRTVNVLFERGKKFGETDLVVNVDDRFPLRVYAGAEDSGTELTGKQRYLTGFNWGNVFGLDHQLNYQFITSSDSDALDAHSFNYVAPLSWRHTLSVFGASVKSDPAVTEEGFDLGGENDQLGLRYSIPLSKYKKLNHELVLGYDYKRSNNNLEFGGESVFDTFTTISQFSLSYSGSVIDKWGATSFGGTVNVSPGDTINGNSDAEFAASRESASSDYTYGRFNLSRVTRLPRDFSWVSDLQLQASNRNLLGSEQFGIGGYQTVRGYDSYAAVGDEGVLFKNEIRTPTLSFLKKLNVNVPKEELQFLLFMDYGSVKNVEPLEGEIKTDLMSAGVGVRYSIGPNLTFRADYGRQLKALPSIMESTSQSTIEKDSRVHVGIVFAY